MGINRPIPKVGRQVGSRFLRNRDEQQEVKVQKDSSLPTECSMAVDTG
jgi:hypothetical protein